MSSPHPRGVFVTLEGIDGAGKSTQFAALVDALRAVGRDVVATREPGGTPLGERIRELLLHEAMSASTEALLMFAARQEHVLRVIEPALLHGSDVVCDRFTDASLAYQGAGKGIPLDRLQALAHWVHPGLRPDLSVLLDLPPEIAAQRLRGRDTDRFEREPLAFFERVRAQYLELAATEPQRWLVVDATAPPDRVAATLGEALLRLLAAHR
jgi:dTMP kinase